MRALADWLSEYGESHRNHANKIIHWICVPLIMLALVALFAAIPRPAVFAVSPWLHWGTVLIVLALVYYFALSPSSRSASRWSARRSFSRPGGLRNCHGRSRSAAR